MSPGFFALHVADLVLEWTLVHEVTNMLPEDEARWQAGIIRAETVVRTALSELEAATTGEAT